MLLFSKTWPLDGDSRRDEDSFGTLEFSERTQFLQKIDFNKRAFSKSYKCIKSRLFLSPFKVRVQMPRQRSLCWIRHKITCLSTLSSARRRDASRYVPKGPSSERVLAVKGSMLALASAVRAFASESENSWVCFFQSKNPFREYGTFVCTWLRGSIKFRDYQKGLYPFWLCVKIKGVMQQLRASSKRKLWSNNSLRCLLPSPLLLLLGPNYPKLLTPSRNSSRIEKGHTVC